MKLRLLLSFPRSYFFPLTSGILLSLTLVYIGLSPLAWIALIPFLFFSTDPNISYWKLLKGTLLMGAIYYFFVTYPLLHLSGWWWTGSSGPSAMMFAHIKYSFIVLATALWSALWYLPSAFFIRKVGLRSPYVFVIAPVWAVVEYIRAGYGLDGYSWGALGYALTDTEYLKYIARLPLGGVYALSTLVVLGNLALVDVFSQILQTKESFFLRIRNTFREFIKNPLTHLIFWIFSLLLVASFIFGMVHTRTAESAGIPLRVAVVSSPLNTAESASESGYRYYRKKLNVAFSNNAQLIVLPENAFPYFELDEQSGLLSLHNRIQLTDRDLLYADLLALSVTHPDSVIAAGLHTQRDDKKYNSTVFLSRGSPIAFYHKRTLIPFTEYSPFGLDIPVAEPLTAQGPLVLERT